MFRLLVFSAGILINTTNMNSGSVAKKKVILTYGSWEEVKNSNGVKTYVRWL
jgi:hypothetical protein